MSFETDHFCVFASEGKFLTGKPSWTRPGGQWGKDIERALRYPVYPQRDREDNIAYYTLGDELFGTLPVWNVIRHFRKKFPPAYWPKVVIFEATPRQVDLQTLSEVKDW